MRYECYGIDIALLIRFCNCLAVRKFYTSFDVVTGKVRSRLYLRFQTKSFRRRICKSFFAISFIFIKNIRVDQFVVLTRCFFGIIMLEDLNKLDKTCLEQTMVYIYFKLINFVSFQYWVGTDFRNSVFSANSYK